MDAIGVSLIVLASAAPALAVSWVALRVIVHLKETNRELLKAALVAKAEPMAATLAQSMEQTDRIEQTTNAVVQRRPRVGAS